jgi:hypothetical protein
MKLISHRRNTLKELNATPRKYGVEVDIRSEGKHLIVHHEAFIGGECFESWIAEYKHGTLILNVKEEGLEGRLIALMQSVGSACRRRSAVRISEFESIDTAMTLAGKVDWIWVDCFTKLHLCFSDYQRLKSAGFKLCLVSPELQGRDAISEIPLLHKILIERAISMDAICTKRPDLWEALSDCL